jgi:hypothetical protein
MVRIASLALAMTTREYTPGSLLFPKNNIFKFLLIDSMHGLIFCRSLINEKQSKNSKNNAMQLDMFNELNVQMIQMRNEMNSGNFTEVLNKLHKIKSYYLTRDEFEIKKSGIQYLLDIESAKDERLDKYVDVYLNLDEIHELKSLKDAYSNIRVGLSKIISGILDVEDYDFINPMLHPSRIFLLAKEYKKAIANINIYLEKKGENSLIRQYQAFAYYLLNNYSDARRILTFAYFNDPAQCDENFIYEKYQKELFESYKQQYNDLDELWVHFVFHLWKEGELEIIFRAQSFEKYIINSLEKSEGQCSLYLVFLRSLYLAELYRLKNENFDYVIKYRKQMKSANEVLFDEYLLKIS